jgi:murein DD-endopeptidase MepM/ murein hydrolase activator NlpD
LFQRSEHGFGQTGLTLTLNASYALPAPRDGWQGRLDQISDYLSGLDLVPDLGANVGSMSWFRGLLNCTALCMLPILFFPKQQPLPMTVPSRADGDAWEETRAQTIAPLAWGGDTGKHMAATDAVVALANAPERPTLELMASLGQGDGFARVLERAGVGEGEAHRVADLVSSATDLGAIKPGTQIKLTLGRRANRNLSRPLDFLAFRARLDLGLALKREGAELILQRMPIAVDRTPLRIQGQVGDSLYRSARAAGVPAKAVEAYIRAIASRLSLGSDVNADARFDLIVEHARAATGETEVGSLLYAGLYRGSRKTQLLQWNVGGRSDWYEASGVGQSRGGGFARPVAYARISSGFGMRFHPLLGYTRLHRGVDYAAPYGAPIRAVSDGHVALAGWAGGYGNQVRLSHSNVLGTSYSHMSRIVVSPGTRVLQGQVIGYVGSTGLSTGPHLHFEVYRSGQVVNPMAVSFASTSLLSGADLAKFRARLSALLNLPVNGADAIAATVAGPR